MLARHIKEILRDKALVLSRSDGRTILREKDVMELEVADIPSDITIINMQRIGSLSALKDGEWKQVCDFLLLFEDRGKDYAIFIELKKTLDENNKQKGKEQLRRSLPFLEYLRSVCKIQHDAKSSKLELMILYSIIGKQASQRFDKQHVKPGGRLPTENHKGISVGMFVRERIHFRELWRQ